MECNQKLQKNPSNEIDFIHLFFVDLLSKGKLDEEEVQVFMAVVQQIWFC
jgi:hypothetical protein